MGLTLRDGDREYYYAALDRYFPGLKKKYMQNYGNAYMLPSPHSSELMSLFRNICNENGMMYRPEEIFGYMNELPEKNDQISIFDM